VRRVGQVLLALVAVAVVAVAGLLAWTHVGIRRVDPKLPVPEDVLRVDLAADLPVRIRFVDTATQRMPRSAVLDPDLDPQPGGPYEMSHASFVLEWPDGRLFAIDTGMEREAALAFGRPIELLAGADPIEPHASLAERLGADAPRLAGVGFTHLHEDHSQGIGALCAAVGHDVVLLQTRDQAERGNYTTHAGRVHLREAPCLGAPEVLEGSPLLPAPGFPGLFLVAAGGHTPGSTLFVAHVRRRGAVETWVVTGDIVNHIDGVRLDLPKPRLYSLLVVPEAPARLARVRGFLAELARRGAKLLVSHDRRGIESTGIEPW
jgi:glyoxylase-like metal-dependent hydrolase (beta-lactamase superfamily II)